MVAVEVCEVKTGDVVRQLKVQAIAVEWAAAALLVWLVTVTAWQVASTHVESWKVKRFYPCWIYAAASSLYDEVAAVHSAPVHQTLWHAHVC